MISAKFLSKIPAKFLSKIGIHEVEIEGVKVKVSHVTDNNYVLDHRVSQLMAALNKKRPVVGVDVKSTMDDQEKNQIKTTDLLILFGGNRCLVISLAHLHEFPDCLRKFLDNKKICFVGIGLNDEVRGSTFKNRGIIVQNKLSLRNVVEIRDLAARVVKKPNLSKYGLEELDKEVRKKAVATDLTDQTCLPKQASEAGVSTTALPGTSGSLNWKAMVFSDEEIKYVIHDAHICCAIGDKMLRILGGVKY